MALVVNTEDDAVVTDTATESIGTFELHNVARERVLTHQSNGSHDPALAAGGDALKTSLRAVAYVYCEVHGRVR